MKILVSSIIDLRRGPHNRIHEFLRELSRRHEVTVFNVRENRFRDQARVNESDAMMVSIFERLRIEDLGLVNRDPTYQDLSSPIRFRRILERCDLDDFDVHVSLSGMVFSLQLTTALARLGVPTVYDLADDLPHMVSNSTRIPKPARPAAAVLARYILKRNLSKATALVTINRQLAAMGERVRRTTHIIPNGVDCKLFRPDGHSDLRAELGLSDAFVIGYEGVLREWLDFTGVFGAMHILQSQRVPVRLLLVGGDYLDGLVLRQAEVQGVRDAVVPVGAVAYSDVPAYLHCMDVGVIPFSRGRIADCATPLKLFEYMASGIPVVPTNLKGVREAVGALVEYAEGPETYARAFLGVAEGDDVDRSARALSLVRNRFSWDTLSGDFERLTSAIATSGESVEAVRIPDVRSKPVGAAPSHRAVSGEPEE